MEIFRVSRNAWGQETLVGVSWDLLWVFIGAAFLFVAVHIVYKIFYAPKEPGEAGEPLLPGDADP